MNHLLHQLASRGYLSREAHPHNRRTRAVRLTEHGWAAQAVIEEMTTRLDRTWHEALGDEAYRGLARGLQELQDLLEARAHM